MVRVPLDRVFDNPFQTRQVYAGIEELAESILKMKAARPETSGLMQVGTGRILLGDGQGWKIIDPAEYGGVEAALNDEPEAFVQIAFAHRRLRAFRLLSETDPDYATYPVEIVKLDNNQMADLAWEENAKRKDLTAIEEAEALANAIDLFKYTQAEIGQRWGLSQSAVANKLRLMKLPEEAQQAIRDGQLSEKAARTLLTAMGKSEAVYELAAQNILPPVPVEESVQEEARAVVESMSLEQYRVTDKDSRCSVCGSVLREGDSVYKHWNNPDVAQLCWNCYRIGNDWQPPSATEAEKLVQNASNRNQCVLSRKDFPLDVQIAEGADGVMSGKCIECPLHQMDGEESVCFNRECAETKEQRWKAFLYNQLRERLERDYKMHPSKMIIFDGYTGTALRSDSCDAEMVARGGPCSPGNCKRLQFRYTTWDLSNGIKPYKDLPFYFYCNHTGAHNAAQRRYLESQKGNDERSEAAQAAEQAQARKAEARKIFDNARDSIRQALAGNKIEAWNALAKHYSLKEVETIDAILAQFAENILARHTHYFMKAGDWYWERDNAIDQYKSEVYSSLEGMHIARLPELEEITTKIEKILDFVYGHRIDGKITIEQVEGNRVNLERMVEEIRGLHRAGRLNGNGDLQPIINLIRETTDELWEAASDIDQPLPQDWGISLEMSLNELIASSGETVR